MTNEDEEQLHRDRDAGPELGLQAGSQDCRQADCKGRWLQLAFVVKVVGWP